MYANMLNQVGREYGGCLLVVENNNIGYTVLDKLIETYANRGKNLICISKKWSFRTAPNLSKLMSQQKSVEKKLSQAAVET